MKKFLTVLFLLFIYGNSYAQAVPSYIPTSGLIAWYPFTGNADDSSGHGNNGTVYGATLTSDRFGNPNSAYLFNGQGDNIQIADSPILNPKKITMNAWVKPFRDRGAIIEKINLSDASNFGYELLHHFSFGSWNGLYTAWNCDGSCSPPPYSCASLSGGPFSAIADSVFSMITVTIDSLGNCNQYVNGVLSYSFSGSPMTPCNSSFSKLYFGLHWQGDSAAFSGVMDEIGIWNRALTPCEITNLYLGLNSSSITNPINDTVTSGATATFSVKDKSTTATYQWQQNSGTGFVNLSNAGPYSGVTTKTLTINPVTTLMNNYQYRCVRSGGICLTDTTSYALLLISPTAVNSILQTSRIVIFPNPAINNLSIKSDAMIYKIEITNIIGQKLLSQRYNSDNLTVDLSSFANGVYFIKVNDLYIQKLIKQ